MNELIITIKKEGRSYRGCASVNGKEVVRTRLRREKRALLTEVGWQLEALKWWE